MAITLLLALFIAPLQQENSYGASVTFEKGQCVYWTGDAGMTAPQFREDLQTRFDVSSAIIIGHRADTPAHCVSEAAKQAKRAGFKEVRTQVDPDAGPVGPPMR